MELVFFMLSVGAVALVYACFYPGAINSIREIDSLNPDGENTGVLGFKNRQK